MKETIEEKKVEIEKIELEPNNSIPEQKEWLKQRLQKPLKIMDDAIKQGGLEFDAITIYKPKSLFKKEVYAGIVPSDKDIYMHNKDIEPIITLFAEKFNYQKIKIRSWKS